MSWLEEQLNFYDKSEYSPLFKVAAKEGYEDCAYDLSKKLLEVLGEELDKDNYLQVKTVIENLGVSLK